MADTLPFFPTSPCPLPLDRKIAWGGQITRYDSGQHQGSTAWTRSLKEFRIQIGPEQDTTIDSLTAFVCDRRGTTRVFWFADPYDYQVPSGHLLVNTGVAVTTFQLLHHVCSHAVYPTSSTLQTITSALSTSLVLGVDYTLDLDNGYITLVVSPNSTDFLTAPASAEFVHKVRFAQDYSDQSRLWQSFRTTVELWEHP